MNDDKENNEVNESITSDEFEQYLSKQLTKIELGAMRRSRGISQKELSAISGLSTKCISDIESASGGNPTLRSIIKYADCLGYELMFKKKSI